MAIQFQEAQRIPYKINPERNTAIYIVTEIEKNKEKEIILKTSRENQHYIIWN